MITVLARQTDIADQCVESPDLEIEALAYSTPQRDTGGEYLGATFLRDGGLAVVTPIQHQVAKRLGFTFWRLSPRP